MDVDNHLTDLLVTNGDLLIDANYDAVTYTGTVDSINFKDKISTIDLSNNTTTAGLTTVNCAAGVNLTMGSLVMDNTTMTLEDILFTGSTNYKIYI